MAHVDAGKTTTTERKLPGTTKHLETTIGSAATRFNWIHTIPPEVVEDICEMLDLASVCALAEADTDALIIPDDVFRRKLEPLCPWFGPQTSHRNSYRECAIEYLRRQQPGAKFAPRLRRVGAEEFGAVEEQREMLAPRSTSVKKLELTNRVYTSEHGIKVALPEVESEDSEVEEGEYEYDVWDWSAEGEFEIVSQPHMLIITGYFEDFGNCCNENNFGVIVKFKDSPGLKSDFDEYRGLIQYSIECVGPHVFLFTISGDCWNADPGFSVTYIDKNGLQDVLWFDLIEQWEDKFSEHAYNIHSSHLDGQHHRPSFYDGMIQYFNGKRYCAFDLTLDKDRRKLEKKDVTGSKHVVDNAEKVGRLIKEDWKYLLIKGRKEKSYILDVTRGLVVDAKELANSGKVDEDLISMVKNWKLEDTEDTDKE